MISPDTPPGTEIVCIDDSDGAYGPSRLTLGEVYTLRSIEMGVDGDFVATLHEVPPGVTYNMALGVLNLGYLLCRFRRLELPNSLTELLTEQPIKTKTKKPELVD
jgi:hypothetical protein